MKTPFRKRKILSQINTTTLHWRGVGGAVLQDPVMTSHLDMTSHLTRKRLRRETSLENHSNSATESGGHPTLSPQSSALSGSTPLFRPTPTPHNCTGNTRRHSADLSITTDSILKSDLILRTMLGSRTISPDTNAPPLWSLLR